MLLAEEYLKRHEINTRYVRHTSKGYVFLKSSFGNSYWNIFYFKKHRQVNTYDRYTCRSYSLRKRLRTRSYFDTIRKECVSWKQFNDLQVNFNLKDVCSVVSSAEEVLLSAWSMFAYCEDSNLSKYINNPNLIDSLDETLSIVDRCVAYEKMKSKLDYTLQGYWNNYFLPLIENYSYWLAPLVEQKKNEEIL